MCDLGEMGALEGSQTPRASLGRCVTLTNVNGGGGPVTRGRGHRVVTSVQFSTGEDVTSLNISGVNAAYLFTCCIFYYFPYLCWKWTRHSLKLKKSLTHESFLVDLTPDDTYASDQGHRSHDR